MKRSIILLVALLGLAACEGGGLYGGAPASQSYGIASY
ncbi:MAG: lipoprotein [Pseudomonadota bacterium]